MTVDPKNPKTVWVGTGETCVRNSVSVGDGLYKTTDGGESWQKVGLADSERIARVVIDPADSNTVLACATGHAFDSHPERGVFRTTDGGKTWEKTLFVNDDTGCSDLAIDPQDGRIVYAGMWQFRRKPYFFTSGGPGSGLYKSTDGGRTWRKVTKGLPEGELGRIALSVSPARTERRLRDGRGEGERRLPLRRPRRELGADEHVELGPRPALLLLPRPGRRPEGLEARLQAGLQPVPERGRREDLRQRRRAERHSDVHALWVDPRNTDNLVMGTDGGVYVSHDRGAKWRFVGSLPVSQFYHVSYDMEWPYNVYGGLQDNSTWYGPSRRPGPIQNKHWNSLTGGDGFWAFVDPDDPDVVYNEYQGGNLFRIRKSTLEQKDIKPSPKAGEPKYRFNWNTPIHLSPNDKGTIYYGAQFLFRSKDRGDSWERISPDLTTNDPAKQKQMDSGGLTIDNSTAENHCTIFAISESPKSRDVVWVGTDDGNVQVTRDGGKTWTNVAGNVPGLPKNAWVSSVQAGRFAEGTAYATFDNHMLGDMKTYVYRTTDFGKTWEPLATADVKGYAHVVKEDVVNPDLLFVGTELGLFVSVDGGKQWAPVHREPAERGGAGPRHPPARATTSSIATHGRGIYIVDDITPLRALTADVVQKDVAFLPSRPAPMVHRPPASSSSPTTRSSTGRTRRRRRRSPTTSRSGTSSAT